MARVLRGSRKLEYRVPGQTWTTWRNTDYPDEVRLTRGSWISRRKSEYLEDAGVLGGVHSIQRKAVYPEEARLAGGSQSTWRKLDYPEEIPSTQRKLEYLEESVLSGGSQCTRKILTTRTNLDYPEEAGLCRGDSAHHCTTVPHSINIISTESKISRTWPRQTEQLFHSLVAQVLNIVAKCG